MKVDGNNILKTNFSALANPFTLPKDGEHPDEIYGKLDKDKIFGWDEKSLWDWLAKNEERQKRWVWTRGDRLLHEYELHELAKDLEKFTKSKGHKVPEGFFVAKNRDSTVYWASYDDTQRDGDGKGTTMTEAKEIKALSIDGYIKEMKEKYAAHYEKYQQALLGYASVSEAKERHKNDFALATSWVLAKAGEKGAPIPGFDILFDKKNAKRKNYQTVVNYIKNDYKDKIPDLTNKVLDKDVNLRFYLEQGTIEATDKFVELFVNIIGADSKKKFF